MHRARRREAWCVVLLCASLQSLQSLAPTAGAQEAGVDGFEPLHCVACAAGEYLSQAHLNCTACPAGSGTFAYFNASSALHCVCLPGFENQTILREDGEMCEPCRMGFYKEQLRNASCVVCPYYSWTLAEGSANVSACVCDPGFSKPSFSSPVPSASSAGSTCADDPTYKQIEFDPYTLEEVELGCHQLFGPGGMRVGDCVNSNTCTRCCASCQAECDLACSSCHSACDRSCHGALGDCPSCHASCSSSCAHGFEDAAPEDHGQPEDHAQPCEPCAPGSFKRAQADEACLECPADHFCPEGSVEPTACPANSSAAPGRAAVEECLCHAGFHFARDGLARYFCQPCAPGFYNELVNQSACVACPADTFNPDTAAPALADCRACDPHAAAPPASFAVEACACNLGYAGEPGQPCSACEPGTFREKSDVYICEACPANTYNVFLHSSSRAACLACHANTSSAPGSRSQRACVCDPGLFGVLDPAAGTDGVYECTPCAAGTYAEAANSSGCDACAPGKFSASVGADTRETCQACASGSVALEPGLTACAPCGASAWQNTSAPGHLALPCEACPANASHALEGVVDVFACVCAPGVYKLPLASGFRCALCEPAARCPGADRIEPCPFNTFSVGGVVTECTPCAEHSRAATAAPLASPAQCQCVPGAEGASHDDCRLCAPGKFQPLDLTFNGTGFVGAVSAQPTECGPCAADEFQPAPGAAACVQCHAHSSTRGAAGSDAAEDCTCDAGFVGEDGVACSLCEPGRFCPGGEASTVCRLFSSSPAGSSEQANCSCNAGYHSVDRVSECNKCAPGTFCPGGAGYVPCANSSSSLAGSSAAYECFCLPGFWRGCTRTKDALGRDAGFVDAAGQPCEIRFEQPCVQCGPNDVCVNDTLLHCPENSASPPGSDDARDCVCNGGYHAEY